MALRLTFTALCATLALGAIAPAAAQNIITNGGFEDQPGFTGNPYDYSNAPASWTTNAAWDTGYNAVAGAAYGNPHSGSYSIRLGFSLTSDPTILSQSFSDVIGALYTVSFYAYNGQYTGNATSNPLNYLTASVGSQSVTVADNVGTYSNGCATCWVQQSFTFVGTGSDMLSFAGITDANYWHLDDVSVVGPASSDVPEPATWATMIFGIGLTGVGMRYCQRKAAVRFS